MATEVTTVIPRRLRPTIWRDAGSAGSFIGYCSSLVVAASAFLVHNTLVSLRQEHRGGFSFLDRQSRLRHRRVFDRLFAG